MARYTNLYQAPRSPLIQGRTRWERPLWQAWLGGAVIGGAVALAAFAFLMPRVAASGESVAVTPQAVWSSVAAIVVGSAIGSAVGRWIGWRWRWLAAAILGVACFVIVLVAMKLFAQPVFALVGRL